MTTPPTPDDEPISFDLHAIESRLGMARFGGKHALMHQQLLLGTDVPRLILYCKTLQGALVHVAEQLDGVGADSNRTLGLLTAAIEVAGGEVRLPAELLATVRAYDVAFTPDDEGVTLRTTLRTQDEAPGEPGASPEEGGAGRDETAGPTPTTIVGVDGAPLPMPDTGRPLRES